MRLVLRKERAAQGVDNAFSAQSRKALIGKIFAGRRRATIALLLTFVIGGAIAWRIFGAAEAPAREGAAGDKRRDQMAVTVSVALVRLADVPVTLDAVGTVQALNTVTARTQVDGRLIELSFAEGQEVKRGDVLARIDPSIYKAQYDQAVAKMAQDEANLANARVDAQRYRKLAAANFGSQQQAATQQALVAQLEAQLRADKAAIDNAETTLDYATIRSPIDGRTGIRLVDVGNILHKSDQTGIVVVTQLKPLWVVFTVPQQSLPQLQKAQAAGHAKVAALAADNSTVIETGELAVIDNQIDAQTGTVRVKAVFQNPDLALWPGQFVNVRVTVDMIANAVTVPSPAVQRGANGAFIYLLGADGTAVLRNVVTRRQDEAIAVLDSELGANEQVIVSGFSRLAGGSKVRVAESEAPRDGGEKRRKRAEGEKK
ncbi:multidrug efflux system membrane fusion protein [Methylosinus sp. sav-2]|uniref:efflux RND transporter periplasmic adaptor subunit n=1 Tax=Methylosinus sp. sav-2 TaxID=2485168 RepID=UPI0009FC00E8|nr:efflux RND transporter periplasmic adaptor subunit [Methylosinus sp. sav-2]TDX66836.1 multidrug efflux system membrane fusion protein [Methylosinus sp. sav-2]